MLGYQEAAAMTVIFDSGPPSFVSVISVSPSAIFAEDFVLADAANLEDAHFWIKDNLDNFDNQVEYFVFEHDNVNNSPGALIDTGFGQTVMSMIDPTVPCGFGVNCVIKEVWFDLERPVPLPAGQIFWLGLRTPFADDFLSQGIAGDSTVTGFELNVSTDGGVNWITAAGFDFPFTLTTKTQIGGKLLPIDTTALLLAGMQTNLAWIIPIALSVIGLGVILVRKKF